MNLWFEKYRPKELKDIIGNNLQKKKCELWLNDFINKQEHTKNCLLISGPPGIGKTSFSHILLNKYDFDTIEFNASDIRNQKLIKEKFTNLIDKYSITSLMGSSKHIGIIMDEVDGLTSGDRGGLNELINYINPKIKNNNPIICICNPNFDKKIKKLKQYAYHIQFLESKLNELFDFAKSINDKENMNLSDDYLLKIVNFSQKDIRKLINTLELFNKKKNQNIDDFLKNLISKNVDCSLYYGVFNILNTYSNVNEILNIFNSDRNLIGLLTHHNILNFIKNYKMNNKEKLYLIENIYESFYESDLLDYQIFNNHHNLYNYNSIHKCAYISYKLNQNKKLKNLVFGPNDLVFSNLLNKFSLQLYNYKTKYNLLHKININSNVLLNDEIFNIIIINIIKFMNDTKIKKKNINNTIIKFIKFYQLNSTDLEKIYKLIKLKIDKTKNEKYYSNLANIQIDKKYFNKLIKIIK